MYIFTRTLETNDQLKFYYPSWNFSKIQSKTGVLSRHISSSNEYAEDLGIAAARLLMDSYELSPENIDAVVCISQTAKRRFPGPSFAIQHNLKFSTDTFCLDINQGCSGFVYGLFTALSILNDANINNVILVTCDSYQKIIDPSDRSTRLLFGDAASASLISNACNSYSHNIIDFEFFSDGSGADSLYASHSNDSSTMDSIRLFMNGAEVLLFSMREVPKVVNTLLSRHSLTIDSIDFFLFHQGSSLVLDQLQKSLNIPAHKLIRNFENIGNTTSSTIPICMSSDDFSLSVKSGNLVLLVGFGVGLSVSACLMNW